MKRLPAFGLAALLIPAALAAQQSSTSSGNPTTEAARWASSRLARYLTSAADQVPAKLLSYKPTEAQMTFGRIWAHLAEANYGICAAIGGMKAPTRPTRDGSEAKETLVAELKASFEFCDQALAKADDSKLSERVSMGFMDGTRAQAMFIYVDDLADHYSQVANYMRLNGMLPPSAQPRGK
jgi:uncharacterized damage-inducible protein DinB